MTQEQRQLLLIDLCARLPYGVICELSNNTVNIIERLELGGLEQFITGNLNVRPYLRPMSSMTEEEAFEMFRTVFHQVSLIGVEIESDRFSFKMVDSDGHFAGHTTLFFNKIYSLEQSDWLIAHHFDYRGLIEKGLALEAPDDMYNIKS